MTLRPPLPGHQLKIGVDGLQQPRHIVMRNGNTFRRAGGARCVDEVGDVVGARHYRQGRTRLAIHRAAVDVHDSQPVPRQPVRQFRGGHHDHRPGITQHKPQPRIRHRRINRHIRRTRLQHPHDRHHSLNRPRQQQRHPLPRPHPMRNQQVRQPIRRLIQPPIRHRPPTTTDRNSPRITHHLLGKQLRNRQRRRGPLQGRSISPLFPLSAFVVIIQVHRQQPPGRIGLHCYRTSPVMASSTRWNRSTTFRTRLSPNRPVSNSTRSTSSFPGIACKVNG
ncbi:Uncharacterised protein [Mycobacteroides abscessus subsp. abscessus]|nr:Uncharacterised protein [Mycobacteroides abscessus subsp. abscessus]SHS18389.1 Uncharacterised protein [Mycobacteroides abscessus subsp. abscessus]SHT45564.1 Uncharacterised protein [Mycobacteroides abscessus subsp. abscessus]SHT50768.1 Uncharacterised protein [Mycobacteroides abscessus subsp. abscessus]SHW00920.1 Uncharacterised protein [Mycobacteroides abscessus subsp. abscessus]